MASKIVKAIFALLFIYLIILLFGRKEFCIWNCSPSKLVNDILKQSEKLQNNPEEYQMSPLDLLIIFTKADENFVLQYNLRRSIGSLLKHTSLTLRLHIIIDDKSQEIAARIIEDEISSKKLETHRLKLVYISATLLAEEVKPQVHLLQRYFTNKSNSYYKDFLFFFSIFIHKLLPGVTDLIMVDIDTLFRGDIAELYAHFGNFSQDHVIGISHELSPVYYCLLSSYRKKNPNTNFGEPHSKGGFPGFNSGVLLIKVARLAESKILNSYLTEQTLRQKTKQYRFHGHLGDQDLFTLMSFDHPEIFYTLPCNWNRQRCDWWSAQVPVGLFDIYFHCESTTKLAHGNCKSVIPDYPNDT